MRPADPRRSRIGITIAIAMVSGCASSSSTEPAARSLGTAAERGRALFSDPAAARSAGNPFSCATCHPGEGATDRVHPGASLAGATTRPAFWGGKRLALLEAVNDCRTLFMGAPVPWTSADDDARAMWAYLESRQGDGAPTTFSLPANIVDLPAGDPARGSSLYLLACASCHGAAHTGAERIASFVPRLPEDVGASHAALVPAELRLVYIRKIRLGAFADTSGRMPPFPREALADVDVAAILSGLGLYRQ